MVVFGLTGPIGSGKSQVARILEREGVPVLSSDAIAHELMERDPTVRRQLQQLFGNDVVPESGPIDRAALAQAVFGSSLEHHQRRRALEQIVHPRVLERIAAELDRLDREGTPLAFVESALIYEAGIEELFDYVVAVVAPYELRRQRVHERGDGADFSLRQRTQLSDEEIRQRADFVITNDGSLAELEAATKTFLAIARHLPPRPVERHALRDG